MSLSTQDGPTRSAPAVNGCVGGLACRLRRGPEACDGDRLDSLSEGIDQTVNEYSFAQVEWLDQQFAQHADPRASCLS